MEFDRLLRAQADTAITTVALAAVNLRHVRNDIVRPYSGQQSSRGYKRRFLDWSGQFIVQRLGPRHQFSKEGSTTQRWSAAALIDAIGFQMPIAAVGKSKFHLRQLSTFQQSIQLS